MDETFLYILGGFRAKSTLGESISFSKSDSYSAVLFKGIDIFFSRFLSFDFLCGL